ncbi:DNA-directed RNA polymerase sigma-70 factor [Paenibacillus baekrokdamisoli]|uniref:DNA-directed RNA polymerase sigma-70 factor n=2 Tax=Paenibacillus baekrokdamisoli TaxID=1712516 RepID=A0A3G9J257_9BACL|nr:sigma-70 family RNA polymerase sigma factor [Paenibacillus baekrokdamisoli]MBB3068504.1 RNA polymerase sigma-70 factor (ECF subfamily) [Paenibacillus baekrokdamisoli]BBH22455.1 DNA-directed RNA polymerase sigma-70 factor [Paenibacillus baekrokdamisoli]
MQSKLLLLLECHFGALKTELQKEVYMEFYRMVYGSIIYMVKEHAATEDIIQESFLKAIRKLPDIDSEYKLKGWIRVVVKNTTYNYLRKSKKNRNEVDAESVFINDSIKYATDAETIENEVELKIMIEEIDECLNELKPEYRALVELRWKQDMSYKEIADVLDTTEQTVKYKLHRAREAIKKRVHRKWGEAHEQR